MMVGHDVLCMSGYFSNSGASYISGANVNLEATLYCSAETCYMGKYFLSLQMQVIDFITSVEALIYIVK